MAEKFLHESFEYGDWRSMSAFAFIPTLFFLIFSKFLIKESQRFNLNIKNNKQAFYDINYMAKSCGS